MRAEQTKAAGWRLVYEFSGARPGAVIRGRPTGRNVVTFQDLKFERSQ
jgi:hypothetical protein